MDYTLWRDLFRLVIIPGLLRTSILFWERVQRLFRELWDAFPNPIAMADAVVSFFTGLLGFLVQIPIAGVEKSILDALSKSKARHRVFTTEQMIRIWFDIWRTAVQTVTFTGENSLLEFLARSLAIGIWRLSRRIRLIRGLIAAKTEAEMISVFLRSLKSKVGLLRVFAIIIGSAVLAIGVGFFVWTIAMSIAVLEKKVFEKALPQDSTFTKKPHTYRRRRLNLRSGPDK